MGKEMATGTAKGKEMAMGKEMATETGMGKEMATGTECHCNGHFCTPMGNRSR